MPNVKYIQAKSRNSNAYREASSWFIEAIDKSPLKEGAIVIPSLKDIINLDRIFDTILDESSTNKIIEQLEKDREATDNNRTIKIFTKRNLPLIYNGPVLSFWLNDKDMIKVDSMNPPEICAFPYQENDIDGWILKWNLGDDPQISRAVSNAIQSVSELNNLKDGALKNPLDNSRAVWALKILKNGGETFAPEDIEILAIENHWNTKDAAKYKRIAQKILDGEPVQSNANRWNPNILHIWQSR